MARQDAALGVDQGHLRIGHLTFARLAAQLAHGFGERDIAPGLPGWECESRPPWVFIGRAPPSRVCPSATKAPASLARRSPSLPAQSAPLA